MHTDKPEFYMPLNFAEQLQIAKKGTSIDEYLSIATALYALGDVKKQSKFFAVLKKCSYNDILKRCKSINKLNDLLIIVKGNCKNDLQSASSDSTKNR